MEKSISPVITKLEDLFRKFNEKFYENGLYVPIITVSPDMTQGCYGWCTAWKAWKDSENGGYYEINITAERLNRKFVDICATMLHEMVHLYNMQIGAKDTSRGYTYHNKVFKVEAENHGLEISHDEKYGWTITKLKPEVKDWLEEEFKDFSFDIHRTAGVRSEKPVEDLDDPNKPDEQPKKKSSIKLVCPKCGCSVRATKEVHIKCVDCDEEMKEKEK